MYAVAQVYAEIAILTAPWCSYKSKYLHVLLLFGVKTGTYVLV